MRSTLTLVFAIGCSSPPAVPDGGVDQTTLGASLGTAWSPALVVFVVDDGDTALAQSARDLVTPANLDQNFEFFWKGWRGCELTSVDDPASQQPTDIRAFVVHPSAPSNLRLVAPIDDARLAITSNVVVQSDLDALEASLAQHVQEGITPESATYPLLESMRDAVSLLLAERAPRDAREASIVATIPVWRSASVIVLTSRDDASSQPPSAYAPPANELGSSFEARYSVWHLPCNATDDASFPKLGAWQYAASRNWVIADVSAASCAFPLDFDNGRQGTLGWVSESRPIVRDAFGDECTITIAVHDSTCDAARGWADPVSDDGVRRPMIADNGLRHCEILQLRDAQLDACRNTLDCSTCGAGWCITDVPALQTACQPSFRFVGRARPDGNGNGEITCNLVR